MNSEQLNLIQNWFLNYTQTFKEEDGKLVFPLQMKMEHSARVVDDSRTLARQAGWTEPDVRVAEAIGWLHDVARFSQFKEFHTFHDPRSANHGEWGWDILKQGDLLVACDPLDRQRVLDGVRYHNRKTIPVETAEDSLRFVKLIRDADKIDIYKIFDDSLAQNLFERYPDALLHVSMEGAVNPL
ncbi:MAG: HD domain-containing protein, partial [Lentisphaerota bacterium]